jgi:hypothetical protein
LAIVSTKECKSLDTQLSLTTAAYADARLPARSARKVLKDFAADVVLASARVQAVAPLCAFQAAHVWLISRYILVPSMLAQQIAERRSFRKLAMISSHVPLEKTFRNRVDRINTVMQGRSETPTLSSYGKQMITSVRQVTGLLSSTHWLTRAACLCASKAVQALGRLSQDVKSSVYVETSRTCTCMAD